MPTIDVYNMEGKVCGTMELSDTVFAAEVNVPVIHSVVRAYLLNQRQGTQSTLTRSEVAGGGRKHEQQLEFHRSKIQVLAILGGGVFQTVDDDGSAFQMVDVCIATACATGGTCLLYTSPSPRDRG